MLKNDYLLHKFRKNKSRHQATYIMCQNSNENKLTSIKSLNYLSVMVLLKSLLINYHYLVNAIIIFVNILIYVGSSIWEHRPFGKNMNQYLDFCIFDKLLTMLKEPQTSSIYWFYLLHKHVDTSTKSK